MNIRAANTADDDAIRKIALDTGYFGAPTSSILDDGGIFLRTLDCYLNSARRVAFVAEEAGEVCGYVLASTADTRLCTVARMIGGTLLDLVRWPRLSSRDRRYIRGRLGAAVRAVTGEERRFRAPGGASLHVNLLPQLRGSGAGSLLLGALFDELRKRGVTRIHANSYQTAANLTAPFWLRNGFSEYSRVRSSAWKAFTDDEVDLVSWVRVIG